MYALPPSSPAQRRRGGAALLLAALAVWVLSSCGLLALSQAQTLPLKDIKTFGSYFESVAGPCRYMSSENGCVGRVSLHLYTPSLRLSFLFLDSILIHDRFLSFHLHILDGYFIISLFLDPI